MSTDPREYVDHGPLFVTPPAQRHSETSLAAAESVAPRAKGLRGLVLAFIRANGPVTDEAIAEGLGLNPSTARPRRIELLSGGLIVQDGEGLTKAGKRAARWRAA